MASSELTDGPDRLDRVRGRMRLRQWLAIGALLSILAYLVYAWIAFDATRVFSQAKTENARLLAVDAIAHKVHITRLNRRGELSVAIEGERTATYALEDAPAWITLGDDRAEIDLGEGYLAVIDGASVSLQAPGYGEINVEVTADGLVTTLPPGPVPEWIKTNETVRFDARPSTFQRVQATRSKIEVHRYFYGWENFWFAFNSDLHGMSFSEIAQLAVSGERMHEALPNYQHIFLQFWRNQEWQHNEVFIAVWETILMAVLGTITAAFVALPLAFLAASNFTPAAPIRFAVRRLFDFLRGVDALIWSLIFIRAFGLGPLTGALAIAFTDTGTLGKLFSEALENIDKRQVEGVQATGARPIQRYRFGVIPQMMPVFISQSMYYLESNTRSATVIGALGAGGIGLILVQTMNTKQDWENTTYIIVLIILLVFIMDTLSGWLRRRLIHG